MKNMERKRITFFMLLVGSLLFGIITFSFTEESAPSEIWYVNSTLEYKVPKLEDLSDDLSKIRTLQLGKSYIGFKEALAFKESQGIYNIVNTYGYIGKYQFAPRTLIAIGVTDIEDFKTNTMLQEKAFLAFTSRNKWLLRKYIQRYEGKAINGIEITESGLLAAAHLAGASNVKKYLQSDGSHHVEDAFGTTIQIYLKNFSGYDTSIIPADAQAKVCI